MKAIYIEQHSAVEDLNVSDVPVPSITPGEVLVKVAAAGINPSDIVSVQGKFANSVLPRIVGGDFAGRIEEAPPNLTEAKSGAPAETSELLATARTPNTSRFRAKPSRDALRMFLRRRRRQLAFRSSPRSSR